jgi:hypothetical protein
VKNIQSGWCKGDALVARAQGWELRVDHEGRLWADDVSRGIRFNGKAFQTVLETAMTGDAAAYKALRWLAKNNPSYRKWKKTVRAIYKQFHRVKSTERT